MKRLIIQLLILAISGLIQWWSKPKNIEPDSDNHKPNPPPTE